MKKTKWFVFLAITIVAALYVFVETPNLSPLYLDGALFWAVLITAYVGSATLLKIGEFTIQLNNFSYSAKAKFPKVPAIIIAVPWVIIAVVLIVCSVFFQWKAYRDQLGEPQIKTFDSEVQTIDISQIPIVDEPLALQLAQKKLGERPALGSQVELQTATIQMVDGELVWVVPLYHSGFFKWLTNMEGTPGYIVVSATNTNDVRYVEGSKIKYHPGSYLLFDVARKVRGNMPGVSGGKALVRNDTSPTVIARSEATWQSASPAAAQAKRNYSRRIRRSCGFALGIANLLGFPAGLRIATPVCALVRNDMQKAGAWLRL